MSRVKTGSAVAVRGYGAVARLVEVQVRMTDPEGPIPGDTAEDAPGAEAAPADAGRLETVAGTGTGLQREVGRMADGRRITYYWGRRRAEP